MTARGVQVFVPLRSLEGAKSRLVGTLSASARVALVSDMLDNVLTALRSTPAVGSITVVAQGALTLPESIARMEDNGGGLNAALTAAVAARADASAPVLLLAADLPLASSSSIAALLAAAQQVDVVIARDRAGRGTNALWLRRSTAFRLQFGVDSAAAHLREAERLSLRLAMPELPALAFDVDSAADLRELQALRMRRAS